MKLLVTGFGPFPGAPENPTEPLMGTLRDAPLGSLRVAALKAVVLPTEYACSWELLRQLYADFAPDIVVHFGLSLRAEAILVERVGRNHADPDKPDAAGHMPSSGRVLGSGPDTLSATLPVAEIVDALVRSGVAAVPSDDAGAYVCNAALYRSLHAEAAPCVGFVHVPPVGQAGFTQARLEEAASIVLSAVTAAR